MPYTTVVSGTTITASWGNANVRDQVVTPFATASARTSAITSPVEGMVSYRSDVNRWEGYQGASWVAVQGPFVYLVRAALLNVTSAAAEVPLPWDTPGTGMNDYAMWSSGNTSRLVMPWTGAYRITANLNWTINGTGVRDVWARLNGSTRLYERVEAGIGTGTQHGHGFSWAYNFTAADYIELMPYQNSGSTLNLAVQPASVLVQFIG